MAQLAVFADTQDTISKQVYKHFLSYEPVSLFVYPCTANCHQHFEVKEDKHCFQLILWKEMVSSSYIWLHIPSSYGPWPDESPREMSFFICMIYILYPYFSKFSIKKRGVVKNRQLFVIFFCSFCTLHYDNRCSETDFTKEKVNSHAITGIPNSSSYCCSSHSGWIFLK